MAHSRSRPGSAAQTARTDRSGRRATTLRRLWANPAGRFLVRYPFFTALVFLVPVFLPGSERVMILATLHSLGVARFVLHAPVRVAEPFFSIGQTSIQIVADCTAMFPTLLLMGAILAFPARWRSKLVGALAGIALMWAYNLIRIYTLMLVLRYAPGYFDLVHVYLWQSVTLLVVLGVFVLWARVSEAEGAPA